MSLLLTIAATTVRTRGAGAFRVQGSPYQYRTLPLARYAASLVVARLGHGVTIYENGKPLGHKRL